MNNVTLSRDLVAPTLLATILLTGIFISPHSAAARSNGPRDNFNSSPIGTLNGLGGGHGWTSSWFGGDVFEVQNSVSYEGSKAVHVVATNGTNANQDIYRTFTPQTSGTLHFALRKDQGDQGVNIVLFSGSTPAVVATLGSDTQPGRAWYIRHGVTSFELQPYTLGSFDTVDVEFDTTTDMYRMSVNGAPYSAWGTFMNDVDVASVDTINLNMAGSGFTPADVYIDDIQITQ